MVGRFPACTSVPSRAWAIELEIDRDGQILVEHDGPIRSPKPREGVLRSLAKMREGAAEKFRSRSRSCRCKPSCRVVRGSGSWSIHPTAVTSSWRARQVSTPCRSWSSTIGRRAGVAGSYGRAPGLGAWSSLATARVFITGADDGTIQVWDTSSFVGQSPLRESTAFPSLSRTIDDGHQAVSSLAISPDGSLLASGSVKGELTIRQWKPSENAVQQFKDISPPQRVIEVRRGAAISSLSFSPDGARLVVTLDSSTSTVDQWDIIPGDPAQIHRRGVFDGAPSNAQSSSFSSDGRFLAIGGKRSVVVWDRQRGLSNDVPSLPGATRRSTSGDSRGLLPG